MKDDVDNVRAIPLLRFLGFGVSSICVYSLAAYVIAFDNYESCAK